MKDRTSLALLKFIGLDASCTEKVVLVLEKGDLPRVRVTSAIKPAPGAEAGLVRHVRDFDMVPHDETRAQRDELLKIRQDLGAEGYTYFPGPSLYAEGVLQKIGPVVASYGLASLSPFPSARAPVPCPLCSAEVGHAQECQLVAGSIAAFPAAPSAEPCPHCDATTSRGHTYHGLGCPSLAR